MTDEPKRRCYAMDDVEAINRRMKEIAAERDAKIAETELPCDTEPTAWFDKQEFDAALNANIAGTCGGATLVKQEDGTWRWFVLDKPSIYSDAYWKPLIDAGILSMVEPGDA